MRRISRFLAVFVFALALSAAPPGAVAIRNARVAPVSGPVIERATVVVRNGLIEAVGQNVQIPPGAWVIEGEGLTVYPGLIDGLSSWGIPQAAPAATPTTGRTSSRTPLTPSTPPSTTSQAASTEESPSNVNSWTRAADLVRPTDRRLESARAAGYTSAVTFPSRGIFAGQGAVINLAGEKPGQMVVASPVAQYLSFTGTSFGTFPSSLMGVFALIRQTYLDAGRYRLEKERYAANPAGVRRPDYDRTLDGVLENKRVLMPATRDLDVERALKLSKELDSVDAVLYGLHGGYNAVDRLKASGKPVLLSLKWPERSRDADPDEIELLRVLELRDKAPSTPGVLAKAGVKFGFYSDGTERPQDVIKAAKRAIDAGLPADAALRAMTLNVAEIYGVADRLGSIEKGKIANLLVTSGDLFQEKTQVKFVFIDGVKFEPQPAGAEEAAR